MMDQSKEWLEGYSARMDGKRDDASPYPEHSNKDDEWAAGWMQADWDREQLERDI